MCRRNIHQIVFWNSTTVQIKCNIIGTSRQQWNFPNWVSTVLGRSATCWIFFQWCVICVRRHSVNFTPHPTATHAQSGLRQSWKVQRKRPSKSQNIVASSRYVIILVTLWEAKVATHGEKLTLGWIIFLEHFRWGRLIQKVEFQNIILAKFWLVENDI